jgi:hypothetical protein
MEFMEWMLLLHVVYISVFVCVCVCVCVFVVCECMKRDKKEMGTRG